MAVVKQKFISNAEALDVLQKRKKEGELGYEQQLTLDYLEKNAVLSLKEANALVKDLAGLGLLSDELVIELTNVLPSKEDEVQAVLSSEKTSLSDEDMKKVLEVLKKHAK